MGKYFIIKKTGEPAITGKQFTPDNTLPTPPAGIEFYEVTEQQYSSISGLTFPAGGGLRWEYSAGVITEATDPRRKVRVSFVSDTVVKGTNLQIQFSILDSGGNVDTAYNGTQVISAHVGREERLFRITFVNGVKQVNVPTTNLDGEITIAGSRRTLIEEEKTAIIVTDM